MKGLLVGVQTVQDQASGGQGMESFYAGWGTLALINAAIARSMDRSGLGWGLLSLFFGPFATFLLAVVGRLEDEE